MFLLTVFETVALLQMHPLVESYDSWLGGGGGGINV